MKSLGTLVRATGVRNQQNTIVLVNDSLRKGGVEDCKYSEFMFFVFVLPYFSSFSVHIQ